MRWLSLRARTFVHATEDEPRVRDALLWSLGQLEEEKGQDRVHRQRLKGHWGNDIVHLEAVLKREEDVERAVHRLNEDPAVGPPVRDTLLRRLDDDHVLHVRLDKQAAVGRRLSLSEGGDAIVVQIKLGTLPPETPLQAWRRALTPS